MNKTILGGAIASLAISAGAAAEDFQFEVGGLYGQSEVSTLDIDTYGAFAEFHFGRVDTSKGPLNEAAFLDKSSSVGVAILSSEADVSDADTSNDVVLTGRFVLSNDLIIQGSYTDFDLADDSVLNIGVGTYLNDSMDIVVSYTTADEADSDAYNVDLHSVQALSGDSSLAYDIGLGYLDVADESGYSATGGVDYYFNNSVSIGASYTLESFDNADSSEVTVSGTYFVTPAIPVSVEYYSLGQDADGDGVMIVGSVRF